MTNKVPQTVKRDTKDSMIRIKWDGGSMLTFSLVSVDTYMGFHRCAFRLGGHPNILTTHQGEWPRSLIGSLVM